MERSTARVATAATTPGWSQLPAIQLPDSQLGMGASLGNGAVWINTKNTGAIERVFAVAAGQSLVGTVSLQYGSMALPLGANRRLHQDGSASFIGLRPDGPRRQFEVHPAYQRVSYTLAGSISVEETTFVPLTDGDPRGDPAVAYQCVRLTNTNHLVHRLRIIAFARLRGSTSPDIEATFDKNAGAIVAWNQSDPNIVRIFGLDVTPTRYDVTFDFGSAYDPSHVHALESSTDAVGDVLGALQLDVDLNPGETYEFTVKVGVYADGRADALTAYAQLPETKSALEQTTLHLEDCLRQAQVMTPDAMINEAALWSKVNMRRVMAHYPEGLAFTNDPGSSSAIVVRDCAWFIYGNDFFMPSFSGVLLENIAKKQYENGKLPEFYDAITGRVEDDGLNINDDTPLYILAVDHHVRTTGDLEWLRSMYGSIARAADYIISQTDDRDLVFCTAHDPRGNVWAIASWRNIIPLYTINGAVTEINAECVAALREAADMAERLGEKEEARKYSEACSRIRSAMDRHLINPDNGLYYLNIDVDGNAHTDVTGDQVFPVMFRACDDETAFRIISRLNAPDFWTSAGLRTASRNDPLYDPSNYSGLMGGVWPGLTWWYAFAAARYHPEFMVRALRSSFAHYAADPKKNNTVPGQFSEWFDGESLTNKGMRLSPWEPPRFLWAAVEGICGVTLTHDRPRIAPLVPDSWSWVALRRLAYHGEEFSYFAIRMQNGFQVYSTGSIESTSQVHLYSEDVSDDLSVFADGAIALGFRRSDRIAVLVGNTTANTLNIAMSIARLVNPADCYRLCIYDSERREWESFGEGDGAEFVGLAFSVDAQGFKLIEIQQRR